MALITVGLSHHTAPLAVREKVAINPPESDEALRALARTPGVRQAAILSTCNRTELYLDLNSDENAPVEWLGRFRGMSPGELEPYLYRHRDDEAVRHVLRVATGLDSMVLGEPQILGQLKGAWRQAHEAGTLGAELERLLQHSFAVAKRVRSDTAIGANPVSVAYAAVRLARQIFDQLPERTAILIGAGDTVELVAQHLHQQGCNRMVVANRSLEKAQALASRYSGYAVALKDLPAHLGEADIIISSTASKQPVVRAGDLMASLKGRKRRPLLIVDLAVPRDVEPGVAELEDVFLYSIDDLTVIIEQGLKLRREAAREAESMIDMEVGHFMAWLRAQSAVPAIRRYRGRAESQRDEVLERARAILARGGSAEEALDYLAHALTRRLTHLPSANLREAARESREDVLDAAVRLLGIEGEDGRED